MKDIIFVMLMFTSVFFYISPSFAGQNKVIAQYSGDESINTLPFTTSGPWVILYTSEGPIEIIVRKKDGAFDRTAIQNVEAKSKGSALQEKAGTYYLDVDAYRPWHIQIRHMK